MLPIRVTLNLSNILWPSILNLSSRAFSVQDQSRQTVFHYVAGSGHFESTPMHVHILKLLPESLRLSAVSKRSGNGDTVLHYAVSSCTPTLIHFILTLLPETVRLQAVSVKDRNGKTVLQRAAYLGHSEAMKVTLSLLPESQRFHIVCT